MDMNFEWDTSKEFMNFKKHGILFYESVETFFDPKGLLLTDEKHSLTEVRSYWIGKTEAGRILTTWFTRRENTIRIIGCAEWRKFRRIYETAQND